MIKNISNEDVHRITSGQVITDISTCVKELVENALDANSTQIEVHFKQYGLNGLEVVDNGGGIDTKDFDNIALKHYTSKLASFSDLEGVKTLGFRGEALSSLCSIAQLKMITTTTPPRATSLSFDHAGRVVDKKVSTRNSGTTVVVSDLFHNLPVRQKDLLKNHKREFNRCIALLQSYTLISTDVKFVVYNTVNGKKTTIVSSQGGSLHNNIISVYGSNGMFGLIPLSLTLDLNKYRSKLKMINSSNDYKIDINGYISKNSFGYGRSSKDRQLVYINKRPVDLKSLSKLVNEVYKGYNLQFPVFFINLSIDTQFIDVNVTPDKKTILIHNELYVIEELRQVLTEWFDGKDESIPRSVSIHAKEEEEKVQKTKVNLVSFRNSKSYDHEIQEEEEEEEEEEEGHEDTDQVKDIEQIEEETGEVQEDVQDDVHEDEVHEKVEDHQDQIHEIKEDQVHEIEEDQEDYDIEDIEEEDEVHDIKEDQEGEDHDEQIEDEETEDKDTGILSTPQTQLSDDIEIVQVKKDIYETTTQLPSEFSQLQSNESKEQDIQIDDINNEQESEDYLTLTVSKSDFSQMKIIGQFNLGFILVIRNNKDLFIIDQHASDEKYNFEQLQKNTVFDSQPLVIPQVLELNTLDELIVMDHLQVFHKNGFQLIIDDDGEPGHRIKLVSLPQSKRTTFDTSDFHELIHLIKETSNTSSIRCSKIRSMFAMRACRKSIMIGKHLPMNTMSRVVKNLGHLDKPWNCPHGRPTMRHLTELKWQAFNEDYVI